MEKGSAIILMLLAIGCVEPGRPTAEREASADAGHDAARDAGHVDSGIIDAAAPDALPDATEDAGRADSQLPEPQLPGCGWVEDGR